MADLLPLFPLRTVLFPGLALPLHIFEPRYRSMITHLLGRPEADRRFGVVALRQGEEVGPSPAEALHPVGCAAHVRSVQALPDGRYDVATSGAQRFAVRAVVATDAAHPYLRAEVEWLPELGGQDADLVAPGVAAAFLGYRAALTAAQGGADDSSQLPDDPAVLSYLVAAAMVLDLPQRQALLAAPDVAQRLRHERRLLVRETALLTELPSLPAVDLAEAVVTPN